ncbi:hypothetical protein [Phreatobacter stygius]|uniref:Uncharacterized protein n=1 Tax=Phreatobacter stygius TaxID=1940610 RepID=A0A4D7BGV9_9HYPH|nr:hypothetical protein [Phreatobacter stygius]QCI68396.1 hypothetical protein E8M01_31710 [Phreatobacter stygius]
MTQSATWDYIRGSDKDGYAIAIATNNTVYESREVDPATALGLTFRHAFSLSDNLLLRSSLSAVHDQTWSRRSDALIWRERLDYDIGPLRLFTSVDTKVTTLNERNIFALGSFLPYPESFVTLSVLPGVLYRLSFGEIGVSLTASRTMFRFETDYLGLRRNNDRVQPNLFASATFWGIKVEGSLSYARVTFPAGDFDNLQRLLYTAKATIPLELFRLPIEKLTLELSSGRTLEDTTLPFSVINVSTLSDARLVAKFNPSHALTVFARRKDDEYVGLGARAVTTSLGAEYAYTFDGGLTAIVAGSWRYTQETGNIPVSSLNLQLGLSKRIDFSRTTTADASRATPAAPTTTR